MDYFVENLSQNLSSGLFNRSARVGIVGSDVPLYNLCSIIHFKGFRDSTSYLMEGLA